MADDWSAEEAIAFSSEPSANYSPSDDDGDEYEAYDEGYAGYGEGDEAYNQSHGDYYYADEGDGDYLNYEATDRTSEQPVVEASYAAEDLDIGECDGYGFPVPESDGRNGCDDEGAEEGYEEAELSERSTVLSFEEYSARAAEWEAQALASKQSNAARGSAVAEHEDADGFSDCAECEEADDGSDSRDDGHYATTDQEYRGRDLSAFQPTRAPPVVPRLNLSAHLEHLAPQSQHLLMPSEPSSQSERSLQSTSERSLQSTSEQSLQSQSERSLQSQSERSQPSERSLPAEASPQSERAPPPPLDMAECDVCNRRFAAHRLERHRGACLKMFERGKKRKTFDVRGERWKGTDAEQYVKTAVQRGALEKPDAEAQASAREQRRKRWQAASLQIRRAAHAGKPGSPETSELDTEVAAMDDRVQCPHCMRKFAPLPAERHIARCKDIRAKPKTLERSSTSAAAMMKAKAKPPPAKAPPAKAAEPHGAAAQSKGGPPTSAAAATRETKAGGNGRNSTSQQGDRGAPSGGARGVPAEGARLAQSNKSANVPRLNLRAVLGDRDDPPRGAHDDDGEAESLASDPQSARSGADSARAAVSAAMSAAMSGHAGETGGAASPYESEAEVRHAPADQKPGRTRLGGRAGGIPTRPPLSESSARLSTSGTSRSDPGAHPTSSVSARRCGGASPTASHSGSVGGRRVGTDVSSARSGGEASPISTPRSGRSVASSASSGRSAVAVPARRQSLSQVRSSGYGVTRKATPQPRASRTDEPTGAAEAASNRSTASSSSARSTASAASAASRASTRAATPGRATASTPNRASTPVGRASRPAARPSPAANVPAARKGPARRPSTSGSANAAPGTAASASGRLKGLPPSPGMRAPLGARSTSAVNAVRRGGGAAQPAASKAMEAAPAPGEAAATSTLPFFRMSAAAAASTPATDPIRSSEGSGGSPPTELTSGAAPTPTPLGVPPSQTGGPPAELAVLTRQRSLEDMAASCASPAPFTHVAKPSGGNWGAATPADATASGVDATTQRRSRFNSPLFDRISTLAAARSKPRRVSCVGNLNDSLPNAYEVQVSRFGWRRNSFISREDSPLLALG